jgi:Zn-dependent protease with chaperone function
VIGSDSLVYSGDGEVIGKPRDLKEAKRNLKKLMAKPHWVYTGVAVIDAASGRKRIDYDKTKIFMHMLTDAEIDDYHRHVNPLDKAGGFDIEGRGALFIHRIEGCYFNVVGLPLAKLRVMLKEFGVKALSFVLAVSLAGCSTSFNTATMRQETLMHSTEKEVDIGVSAATAFEKQFTVLDDVEMQTRVQTILNRIVAVSDRQELIYVIKVIDEKEVNAVSLPGGYIYIFKGLIDEVQNDDQLAAVVAHEVGHITAKHAMKRLQAIYGAQLLQILTVASGSANAAGGVNAAIGTLFTEHSQMDEFEADKLAVKYVRRAGYNPEEVPGMLRILETHHQKSRARPYSYWRTHPHITQRIGMANKELRGTLSFDDYLDLTGERRGF